MLKLMHLALYHSRLSATNSRPSGECGDPYLCWTVWIPPISIGGMTPENQQTRKS